MPAPLHAGAAEEGTSTPQPLSHTVDHFEGRFRPISTLQLCLVWWLYRESHITRRQLRVFFALQEMAERRRYTKPDSRGKKRPPRYTPDELASLVGGRHEPPSEEHLRGDVKRLEKLGLVSLTQTRLVFAASPDQINVDELGGFWDFWEEIPNRRRSVPIPRRTVRALAAGFSKATTGVMIALMIRSLHWHKREGEYRVDGRTKGSWISDVFGVSRRAVTDARKQLIELGWMEPLETTQTLLNRYGRHDRINVDWAPSDASESEEGGSGSATPERENETDFASPTRNRKLTSYESNIKNKKPDEAASGNRLVGNRNKKAAETRPVKLWAMPPGCLSDMPTLLRLHEQAVEAKLSWAGEDGLLEFVALAERARARGKEPEALFAWLLRKGKFEFITQADEDAANTRIKEHFNPPLPRSNAYKETALDQPELTETDRMVRTACQIARQRRIADPLRVARLMTNELTRKAWDDALLDYETRFGRILS